MPLGSYLPDFEHIYSRRLAAEVLVRIANWLAFTKSFRAYSAISGDLNTVEGKAALKEVIEGSMMIDIKSRIALKII